MGTNNSGQKPEKPAQDRSTMAGEQRYQRAKIAELAQDIEDGKVKPEDLPETPSPTSWT